MNELIGWECRCIFNLPSHEWPIEGWPAWVVVDAVDMPMVKMRSRWAGLPMWVNASTILTLEKVKREERPRRPLIRFVPWRGFLPW